MLGLAVCDLYIYRNWSLTKLSFIFWRQLFTELRLVVETLCSKPQCPSFVKNLCYKGIEIVCRLAPSNWDGFGFLSWTSAAALHLWIIWYLVLIFVCSQVGFFHFTTDMISQRMCLAVMYYCGTLWGSCFGVWTNAVIIIHKGILNILILTRIQ